MRLLHFRNDHQQRRPVANESKPQSGGDRSILARQCVPLRYAPAHHRRGPAGGQDDRGARAMSEPSGKFVLEPERYEFAAAPMHQFELARSELFKLLGAGIAVFAIAKDATAEQETAPGHRSFHNEEWPKDINAWLHIGEDGTVTGFTGKAEIGQNARTELAQTIADELRVPFESVRMVMADTALTPFDAGTFGSRTTPTITPQLRRVSAAARDILVEAAAKNWNVAPEGLVAAEAMTGVFGVRDGEFVGAAAPSADEAQSALDAIHAQWKEVPQIANKEIFSYLKQNAAAKTDDRFRKQRGSVEEGLASAAHRVDATYTVAYIAHAPLEPRAAVAQWADGKLTVWTGTQRPFANRDELADIFHLSESDVRVIVPDTGSAYGGKHTSDAAIEAARLARAAGRPVKVVWTREEEFTWAYFRPAGVIEVKSGIASDGTLTAWDFHNYHSGASGIDTPYVVLNQRTEYHPVPLILRSGSYRGLAATANHFARETHMDALTRAARMDPLDFRLKNLSDPRLRAVMEAAAKSFGWPHKKTQERQGFGLACGYEKGSYVATFAEVVVDKSSDAVRVARMVEAFECGAIVNPDGLRNQVVGAMIQGLGGALFEAVEFENGRIKNPHFASYRVPRFRDVPEIETILLDRKDIPSAGAGETPIMAVAPAIGNAIFDATGIRLNNLPMVPNGLRSA